MEFDVVNCHTYKPNRRDLVVYVGRGKPCWFCDIDARRFGNPFIIDKDGDRDDVIKKYKGWFLGTSKGFRYQLLEEIHDFLYKKNKNYKRVVFACWCSPKQCHANFLKRYYSKKIVVI